MSVLHDGRNLAMGESGPSVSLSGINTTITLSIIIKMILVMCAYILCRTHIIRIVICHL